MAAIAHQRSLTDADVPCRVQFSGGPMILFLALLASPRAATESSCPQAQRSQGGPR
jgi:hypothetical protein